MNSPYDRTPQYMVIAKRAFHNEFATFPRTFGVTSECEEQWTALEAALRGNPDMRQKFKGWSFMVARIDECILVKDDGTLKVNRGGSNLR